jgi:hypothetical protein
MVPLTRVVKAAIVDSYGDIGKTQELFTHWAARGLRKLNREVLKTGKQSVFLKVNKNTNTVTLPCDFEEEIFVGRINEYGVKVPLQKNTGIVDVMNASDETVKNKCEKCSQDKTICEDLQITEDVELVTINNQVYEKTTIKKLHPNGAYTLETTTPMIDVDQVTIRYLTEKQFIGKLSLKPCGCLEPTSGNMSILQRYNPNIFYRCYARCASSCNVSEGGYRIFEETGLMQLDRAYNLDYVYMEYRGFIPKINGQYYVPEAAFETLVNWTKFKSVENKSGVTLSERNWVFEHYRRERANMQKELGRVSLSSIMYAAIAIPKFDLATGWYGGFFDYKRKESSSSSSCSTTQPAMVPTKNTATFETDFRVGDAGYPQHGDNTFYSSSLIGMSIMVYREGDLQFEGDTTSGYTFNVSTGVITFYPSLAAVGDHRERISIRGYKNL